MNFLPAVFLAPVDGDVFAGAVSKAQTDRVLNATAATTLSGLRRRAVAEQHPYDTQRLAYLDALAQALYLDFMSHAPLPYTDGGDRRHEQVSLVAEFFLLAMSLSAQYERSQDVARAYSVLRWADDQAFTALSPTVIGERLVAIINGVEPWRATLAIAQAACALKSAPPQGAARITVARALRELAKRVGTNPGCESTAQRLELDTMRSMADRMDVLHDRVVLLWATDQQAAAQIIMAEHSATTPGLADVLRMTPAEARIKSLAIIESVLPTTTVVWPPPVSAVSLNMTRVPLLLSLQDAGVTSTMSIPLALELRCYAVEAEDKAALAEIDAWLGRQGYTLKRVNVRETLAAAGLSPSTPAPSLLRRALEAVKTKLSTPTVLTWEQWRAAPPPAEEWTARPLDWRAWFPADAATRHASMAVYTRKTWKEFGVPRQLLPPHVKKTQTQTIRADGDSDISYFLQ